MTAMGLCLLARVPSAASLSLASSSNGLQVGQAVRLDNLCRGARLRVGQLHRVVATFGKQA